MKFGHEASDLKLKAVGMRVQSKPTKMTSRQTLQPFNSDQHFEEETFLRQQQQQKQCKPSKATNEIYSAIEDPRISRFTYSKILIIQKNLLMLTVLILFMGMIKVEINLEDGIEGTSSLELLFIMDLTTLFIVFLIVFRKVSIFQLEIDQRRLYLNKKQRMRKPSYTLLMLKNRAYLIELIIQFIFVLPHPTFLLKGRTYSFFNEDYNLNLVYSCNDLMSVLMLIKIYIIIRAIVSLTMFATPRATRMCHYSGIDHDFLFTIKCLQNQYPLQCTTIIFGLSLLIFGYGFRVTEGQLSQFNNINQNGFQSFSNCYWCAFITMATIGYGDYIPTTILAQVQAIILAIIGVVLNSQLIMAVTEYLKLKVSEARSHTTLLRLIEQQELKKQAAAAFVESIQISNLMMKKSPDPLVSRKIKPNFVELKKMIDVVKSHHKRTKAIISNETMTEQMIKSFQLLKDNFKEIYSMQRSVKRKLQQIELGHQFQYQQIRNSFIDEVSNIMTKISRK